jgi:hypothetical protein
VAESSTLTIRIDEDLKRALETGATAENRTVTDFVIRSVRQRLTPQCRTCGRSDQPGYLPPGLSPAMDEYLTKHREKQDASTTTITTLEHGRPVAYWVRIRNDAPHEGMVMVWLLFGEWSPQMNCMIERQSIPIPIPRGVITGWRQDSGTWFQVLIALGYVSGNAQLSNVLRMNEMAAAPAPSPPAGRPRRQP